MMRAERTAYLLCGTPRTGSTLLCGLLGSTGAAGRPESYFRLPDEQSWADRWRLPRTPTGAYDYREYVRAAIAAGTTPNGVFGGRVMWGTLDQVISKLRAAGPEFTGTDLEVICGVFGRTRFVHLWREDTVAQAVSWTRAEQTGYWHPGDPTTPGRTPQFDLAQIDELVRTIAAHNAAWRDWFAANRITPHPVRYEDLAADPTGVTREILRYLGLRTPKHQSISADHRRQADHLNHEWIERFRAWHDRRYGRRTTPGPGAR